MTRLIAAATLILSLFSFSNAFAYSIAITGDAMGDNRSITSDFASAMFWTNSESGEASDSKSGSFMISSDYGGTGIVETDILSTWNGQSIATGANPFAEVLFDFSITDRATGNVVFSIYDKVGSADDSPDWAIAMNTPLPPQTSQAFQLGTLYDWSLVIAIRASATGVDDGMGGYMPPILNGNANANASILITSIDAPPAVTPIPGAIWLLGSGLVGLFGLRRKSKA